MRLLTVLFCVSASSLACACGSRTGLGVPTTTQEPAPPDVCGSALAAGSPKPMLGVCSTRDGRARGAVAPRSPHVLWTTNIPYEDPITSIQRGTTVVTDATHFAYVGSYVTIGGAAPLFRKVDTRTGQVLWAAPADASANGLFLALPATGAIDLALGGSPATLATYAPASGAMATSSPLGFSTPELADPAIGSDGSLYAEYVTGDMTAASVRVTRVAQGGAQGWTSANLGPPAPSPVIDHVLSVGVTLGQGDAVYATTTVLEPSRERAVVNALDPSDGAVKWTHVIDGRASLPVAAPDGTLGFVAGGGDYAATTTFEVLDALGNVRVSKAIDGVNAVAAVARDGTWLVRSNRAVMALDGAGNAKWTRAVDVDDAALVDDEGTVLIKGERSLSALSLRTGAVIWQLPPPQKDDCISNGTLTLTRDGTVIALQCGGTLFALGD